MSQIKYVHVIEFDNDDRRIRPGKGSSNGSVVSIPTPDNDTEEFDEKEWHRVDYWELPKPMPKSEFVDWWNEHKDDATSPIPAVLEAMGREVETDPDSDGGEAHA